MTTLRTSWVAFGHIQRFNASAVYISGPKALRMLGVGEGQDQGLTLAVAFELGRHVCDQLSDVTASSNPMRHRVGATKGWGDNEGHRKRFAQLNSTSKISVRAKFVTHRQRAHGVTQA